MLIYQFNLTFNRLSLKPHSRSIVYAKTQNQAFHKEFLKRTQLLLFNKWKRNVSIYVCIKNHAKKRLL